MCKKNHLKTCFDFVIMEKCVYTGCNTTTWGISQGVRMLSQGNVHVLKGNQMVEIMRYAADEWHIPYLIRSSHFTYFTLRLRFIIFHILHDLGARTCVKDSEWFRRSRFTPVDVFLLCKVCVGLGLSSWSYSKGWTLRHKEPAIEQHRGNIVLYCKEWNVVL
jgi:hypothetical protein